jgi:hypothetical protein
MKVQVRRIIAALRRGDVQAYTPTREELTERRKKMRISQKNLALLADVSAGIISSINQPGRHVSDQMLAYLWDVLDTSVWNQARRSYIRVRHGYRVEVRPYQQNGGGFRQVGTIPPVRVGRQQPEAMSAGTTAAAA